MDFVGGSGSLSLNVRKKVATGGGKRQNRLTTERIQKIIDSYQFRTEEPRYARRVAMAEIEKNEFRLNTSR